MKVEREAAGHVMRDDRLMYMHRALGRAGGAAGEVEQGQILGIGRRDREAVAGVRHQLMEVVSAGKRFDLRGVADQQHSRMQGSDVRSSATLRLYSATVVTSTRPSPRLIR